MGFLPVILMGVYRCSANRYARTGTKLVNTLHLESNTFILYIIIIIVPVCISTGKYSVTVTVPSTNAPKLDITGIYLGRSLHQPQLSSCFVLPFLRIPS